VEQEHNGLRTLVFQSYCACTKNQLKQLISIYLHFSQIVFFILHIQKHAGFSEEVKLASMDDMTNYKTLLFAHFNAQKIKQLNHNAVCVI